MIIMDEQTYHVLVRADSTQRTFDFLEGRNAGVSISGTDILDTVGTRYSYALQVEPDPAYPQDYHSFYQAISSPSRVHEITLPYGTGTLTFNCKVNGGTDTLEASRSRWHGLEVRFTPIKPQREAGA